MNINKGRGTIARMENSHTLVMACATVIEEMLPLMPAGMAHKVFDFGLHTYPDRLRATLQEAIDTEGKKFETIILGYGLCSLGIVGIRANGCRLVAPRVDDCIAIFLGSRCAYKAQFDQEPGTYYLTKGWIEAGSTPFTDYEKTKERMGAEKADIVYEMMMGSYSRLALINTGQYQMEKYRRYTKETARRFGLAYEEIPGSDALIRKMLFGPWDDDFVVAEDGETFELEPFMPQE